MRTLLKILSLTFLLFFSGCISDCIDEIQEQEQNGSVVYGQVYAYYVPNNETFTLSDVYDAVRWHTPSVSNNLSSCFSNAISSFFDPAYNNDTYAPANSMKRFRNYGPKYYSIYSNGASGSWTVPSGVTAVVVTLWGGGGGGGGGFSSGTYKGGGGGGGGAFAKVTFTVTPRTNCAYRTATVAYGDLGDGKNGDYTQFTSNTGAYVIAGGGSRGLSYPNGAAGGAGGTVTTSGIFQSLISYTGGNGANGTLTYSGGGGSGAGDRANGNSASGVLGGNPVFLGGGAGGNGTNGSSESGASGSTYGGGGGGGTNDGSGGVGNYGVLVIYW